MKAIDDDRHKFTTEPGSILAAAPGCLHLNLKVMYGVPPKTRTTATVLTICGPSPSSPRLAAPQLFGCCAAGSVRKVRATMIVDGTEARAYGKKRSDAVPRFDPWLVAIRWTRFRSSNKPVFAQQILASAHRKHNAVLSVPAHHASIAFGCLFQRQFFDHRAHPGRRGEAQGIFRIRRCSGRPALDVAPPKNQERGGYFKRIFGSAHNNERAIGC